MHTPAPAAIGLVKTFGAKRAVAGLDPAVPRGSQFGLVGPNGAGKTTTLSMATGLLRPDPGRVLVEGIDVWADPPAAKARMGVLPEGCGCSTGSARASCCATSGRCVRWISFSCRRARPNCCRSSS